MDKAAFHDLVIEVVHRIYNELGLKVLPPLRVDERTCGWLTWWRRPVRDYDLRSTSLRA